MSKELSARLQRVEEAQGFADRTAEQLSAEIARLNRQMAEVVKKVQAMEARLARLSGAPPQARDEPESSAS
jgi:uncharacterized coiled-coil protein SlyX